MTGRMVPPEIRCPKRLDDLVGQPWWQAAEMLVCVGLRTQPLPEMTRVVNFALLDGQLRAIQPFESVLDWGAFALTSR